MTPEVPGDRDAWRPRRREGPGPADHRLGGVELLAHAGLDGSAETRQGVLGEQLQDPGVLAGSRSGAVLPLQPGPDVGEAGRQYPVAKDRRVVQGSRLAVEGR